MFRRVLIANRSEIARRIAGTCREMGIETVAVYSDADVGAPLLEEVDHCEHLPGSSSAETYLNQSALIERAIRAGCDAIHPGYGFLAENAAFAEKCAAAGLVFIGPSPEHISLMGAKEAARDAMASAGLPVLRKYDPATAADLDASAFPLLVKASGGGGGIGMQLVERAEDVAAAAHRVAQAGSRYFGSDEIYAEKFLARARHIEVQVAGDGETTIELGERDCSWQRRYQKVVEEAPSPGVRAEFRGDLLGSVLNAVAPLRYSSLGTVECLVSGEAFYFLEMNTRIQVEHRLTELVRSIDLVACQIAIAAGLELPAESIQSSSLGNAIEFRLYAEDPDTMLPSPGTLSHFSVPSGPGILVDTGYRAGSQIPIYYDPMIAKIVVHAESREAAIKLGEEVLGGVEVEGVKTNLNTLRRIVASEEFRTGDYHTRSLEQLA